MPQVDFWSLTQPVGILRTLAAILASIAFILSATTGAVSSSYWAWCMFTWAFCFFLTFLIIVLDFTTVSGKLPFAWDDFTAASAMLAGLMCLSTSVIYPTFFACADCYRQIGASVVSWLCFAVYAGEVVLRRLRPSGEDSGFLSTPAGVVKMLETFIACLIFTSLEAGQYAGSVPMQWCVAVYSLCFIFSVAIVAVSLGQWTSLFPFSFEMLVIVYSVVAAVMYATAMVLWPLYSFQNNGRPGNCGHLCPWDKLVVVTVMTIFNFLLYSLDSAFSIWLVFFTSNG